MLDNLLVSPLSFLSPLANTMEASSKVPRKLTVEDIAKALGRDTAEVQSALEQRSHEKTLKEGLAKEEQPMDDSFADGLTGGAPPVSNKLVDDLTNRVEIMERHVKVIRYELNEVMNDLYRNTIRLANGPKTGAKKFSQQIDAIIGDLERRNNVVLIKRAAVHCDIVYRNFRDPKGETNAVKQMIQNKVNKANIKIIPPFSSEQNVWKVAPRAAFKAVLHAVEDARDDMDAEVPKKYRPTTKFPYAEAKAPQFSLTTPSGRTFLKGIFSRAEEKCTVDIEKVIQLADVTVDGEALAVQLHRFFLGPQKLTTNVVENTGQGFQPAPELNEARKDKFFNNI